MVGTLRFAHPTIFIIVRDVGWVKERSDVPTMSNYNFYHPPISFNFSYDFIEVLLLVHPVYFVSDKSPQFYSNSLRATHLLYALAQ